ASRITTFRTGGAAGYVSGVTTALTNIPLDAPAATIQMAVWDNSSGQIPTWESALGYGSILGLSPKFNVYKIGGITNTPPYLTGLVSFSIHYLEGNPDPYIFLQPQSQTVRAGSNVEFSVGTTLCTITGFTWYQYQWSFNGTHLPGATSSSLSLSNAQFYHSGQYSVDVIAPPYGGWYP